MITWLLVHALSLGVLVQVVQAAAASGPKVRPLAQTNGLERDEVLAWAQSMNSKLRKNTSVLLKIKDTLEKLASSAAQPVGGARADVQASSLALATSGSSNVTYCSEHGGPVLNTTIASFAWALIRRKNGVDTENEAAGLFLTVGNDKYAERAAAWASRMEARHNAAYLVAAADKQTFIHLKKLKATACYSPMADEEWVNIGQKKEPGLNSFFWG
jgi:hypothetical protein